MSRILVSLACLALIAAACGSTPPAPSASSLPVPSPSELVEPSPNLHGAPDLEDLLPDTAATVILSKVSLTGEDFYAAGSSAGRGQVDTLLEELGAAIADLSVAQAADPGGHLVLQIGAFRVRGIDAGRLLGAWVSSQQAAMGNRLQVSNAEVAGRHVTRLVDPDHPVGGSTYAYAVGDTVYLVLADDAALLAEVLAALP